MDVYRKVPKPTNITPPAGNAVDPAGAASNASVAPLITMIAVLAIILIFCFCGAPAVRQFCRKRVCCCCPEPESDETAGTPVDNTSTTPTIILLPFGRMLVVDRSVFAQFQSDDAGLDFMELSANLIRAHHLQYGSTPSILDSETTSKGLSPSSLGLSPPTYDEICGTRPSDLPPSYSEVSLLFRLNENKNDGLNLNSCVQNASNNRLHIKTGGTNVHIENECVPERHRYLASEENFEMFDEAPGGSGRRLGGVESHADLLASSPRPNTKTLSKQSSF